MKAGAQMRTPSMAGKLLITCLLNNQIHIEGSAVCLRISWKSHAIGSQAVCMHGSSVTSSVGGHDKHTHTHIHHTAGWFASSGYNAEQLSQEILTRCERRPCGESAVRRLSWRHVARVVLVILVTLVSRVRDCFLHGAPLGTICARISYVLAAIVPAFMLMHLSLHSCRHEAPLPPLCALVFTFTQPLSLPSCTCACSEPPIELFAHL
eukprot:scaffold311124_cov28-Tisochrysis_lutea.AAC.1